MSSADQTSFLRWREIPAGVWALGLVSMLMDISSEMIHALLPLYLVDVLHTSTLTVGLIEGIAEATASITKIFSGALSDRLGRRKLLAAIGYGLAAVTRPVFALAPSVGWLVAARFIDRVGKGVRGAPRDALIADLTSPALRGASFGLRQSLDTVGAFLGPLLAIVFMMLTADNFTLVFWIAVVPAFLSTALIVFGVHEPAPHRDRVPVRTPLSRRDLARLGRPFWLVVGVATLFTLARFSEAFLLLRAQSVGLPLALAPAVMVVMNIVYSLVAWPAGALSDRIGRYRVLTAGFVLLAAADLVLAFAAGVPALAVGVALWGSRRACWPRSCPTRRRTSCAAPHSARSTSSPGWPCLPPASWRADCGTWPARAARSWPVRSSRSWPCSRLRPRDRPSGLPLPAREHLAGRVAWRLRPARIRFTMICQRSSAQAAPVPGEPGDSRKLVHGA